MRKITLTILSVTVFSILSTLSYAKSIPAESDITANPGDIIILHYSKSVQEKCDFNKQIVPVVGHGTFPYDDDFICVQK